MKLGEIIKKYKQKTFPLLKSNLKNYKYSTSFQIVVDTDNEKELVETSK